MLISGAFWRIFLSTPSGWRATFCVVLISLFTPISIHALRVEGDLVRSLRASIGNRISIHALRVEGDSPPYNAYYTLLISIHALRVEGDVKTPFTKSITPYFYPRPPGGGRRRTCHVFVAQSVISIHALRVEGDLAKTGGKVNGKVISIHALRVEGDVQSITPPLRSRIFLSTPSGWRATLVRYDKGARNRHFYPRPPGGGRR